MGALQVATYYPLHHKALVWPLSACYLLSHITYSALLNRAKLNTLSTCRIFTGFGTDKTIESHHKILKHLLCNPHGYWLSGHPLFSLNTCKTAANDAAYNPTNERIAA